MSETRTKECKNKDCRVTTQFIAMVPTGHGSRRWWKCAGCGWLQETA